MRNGIQLILISSLLLTLTGSVQLVTRTADAAIIAKRCRCGKKACSKCRPVRQKRSCRCPKCNTDVCELKAECVKEKQPCFEVEQKLICIPKVSMPWNKCRKCTKGCCNDCDCRGRCSSRCGKTKTVNVLKSSFRECPTCKYKWKVYEPELQQPGESKEPENAEASDEGSGSRPGFERNEVYDPGGSDVPSPPPTNGSSSR